MSSVTLSSDIQGVILEHSEILELVEFAEESVEVVSGLVGVGDVGLVALLGPANTNWLINEHQMVFIIPSNLHLVEVISPLLLTRSHSVWT